MKSLLVLMFVGVLAALASAGVFMLRKGGEEDRGRRMARALAVRIGLSVALFLLILLGWRLGWIQPRAVPLGN